MKRKQLPFPEDVALPAPIVSTSKVSTGAMVLNRNVKYPERGVVTAAINSVSRAKDRAKDNVYFDAQALAERVLGGHLGGNLLLVGIAYQMGVLPIPADAIEQAIRLNGAAADMNILAFRWDRLAVAN